MSPSEILQRRFIPSVDARATEVDGATVLLHLETEKYFSLNRTGAVVWQALEGGASGQEVVEAVCARFAVPEPTAAADTAGLLERLLEARLIALEG